MVKLLNVYYLYAPFAVLAMASCFYLLAFTVGTNVVRLVLFVHFQHVVGEFYVAWVLVAGDNE